MWAESFVEDVPNRPSRDVSLLRRMIERAAVNAALAAGDRGTVPEITI